MHYRLRTLLIVLALGPIVGAWGYRVIEERLQEQRRQKALSEIGCDGFKYLQSIRGPASHPNSP